MLAAGAQGTKTPSMTEWRKKPWEKPGSVGGPVVLWLGDFCLFIVIIKMYYIVAISNTNSIM